MLLAWVDDYFGDGVERRTPAPGPSAGAGRSAAAWPSRDRPLRALVVEDAADSRELFASEMETAGFVVAQASSGEAALHQVRAFAPDVIVLDLMLPGINGFSVARAVRSFADHRGNRPHSRSLRSPRTRATHGARSRM